MIIFQCMIQNNRTERGEISSLFGRDSEEKGFIQLLIITRILKNM